MKIIDTHCHIYPDAIAEKAVQSIGHFYDIPMNCHGKISELLERASKYDVEKIVVCSVATAAKQVVNINNYMSSQLEVEKFWPLATLHPDMTSDEIKSEVKRIKEIGLKGIKLHPDCQKFSLIEDRAYNIFESLGDFDLPILVHTGDKRYNFTHPSYMVQICRDFPHLQFIAAHFGGWSEWEHSLIYKGINNVMFDTSSSLYSLDKETARRIILELGPEKFMFGTDFPMWNYDLEVPRLLNLDLGNEINELVFYKNAKKLYNIE